MSPPPVLSTGPEIPAPEIVTMIPSKKTEPATSSASSTMSGDVLPTHISSGSASQTLLRPQADSETESLAPLATTVIRIPLGLCSNPASTNIASPQNGTTTGTVTATTSPSQPPTASTSRNTTREVPPPRDPSFEVSFPQGGPQNPRNWTLPYRIWTIICISFSTWVVVFYSTSYTASIPGIVAEFGVSETSATFGVTTYLLGLAVGCVVWAPASEVWGRRWVYVGCLAAFALMVVPCGVGGYGVIVGGRFVGGLFGAAMIASATGTITDITGDEYRALAISFWSIAPFNGPTTGPMIGGFIAQSLGWRWDTWIVGILGLCALFVMGTLRETYKPVILREMAEKRRKETGDEKWWSRYDRVEGETTWQIMKVGLGRPFVLAFTEPILMFFNTWISLIYSILYLCFVAYPIVFAKHRGWGTAITGLSFTGMLVGTLMAIFCEPLIRKYLINNPYFLSRLPSASAHDAEKGNNGTTTPPDSTTLNTAVGSTTNPPAPAPPESAAPTMVLGAILTALGQIGFSLTCLPVSIHYTIPILFGIPFGAGNTLCFIYAAKYLTTTYGIYAASALAGNTFMRSVLGGTLPLAGPAMYEVMTARWAGLMLGGVEVLLIGIPVLFWRYGAVIRGRSRVIREMREDEARNGGGGGGSVPGGSGEVVLEGVVGGSVTSGVSGSGRGWGMDREKGEEGGRLPKMF